MTVSEFKAWLDGFSEAIDGSPTRRQWEKIQDRLDDVKNEPEVKIRYVGDRWYRPWYQEYGPLIFAQNTTTTSSIPATTGITTQLLANAAHEVGKAEGQEFS